MPRAARVMSASLSGAAAMGQRSCPSSGAHRYHGRMSSATSLPASVGLLPLPRPLMTGEVLDAAFRLFRAGLLRCLPYAGVAVLVLELPTLYRTFLWPGGRDLVLEMFGYLAVLLLSTAMLGVITLRLHAISRGLKPRV